jgi:large subunit ribosomal protein L21
MFAIIRTGGKQYRVASDQTVTVERVEGDVGAKVEFADVLMAGGKIGSPLLSGAKVTGTIVKHTRGDTVLVFKKKRRQNYRRKNGHRQGLSVVRIESIVGA